MFVGFLNNLLGTFYSKVIIIFSMCITTFLSYFLFYKYVQNPLLFDPNNVNPEPSTFWIELTHWGVE